MVMEVDPVTSMLFLNDTFQMVMVLTYQSLGATLQLYFTVGGLHLPHGMVWFLSYFVLLLA